ncbi:MAG TPA: hypothetical protein VGG88_12075 [Gaiellaceae bacterium]|jgi:hypothetical protein
MSEPERKAKTESAFREVNERIAENARRFDAGTTDFICECDDPMCTERVEATLDEYEDVRADGTRFLLAPGHGDGSIERVVEHRPNFDIVEKVQRAARAIARRLNPRTA